MSRTLTHTHIVSKSASIQHPTWLPSLARISIIIPGQAWDCPRKTATFPQIPSHLLNPHWVRRQRREWQNGIRPQGLDIDAGDRGLRHGQQWKNCCVMKKWSITGSTDHPSTHIVSLCLHVLLAEDSTYSQSFCFCSVVTLTACVKIELEIWYMVFIILIKFPEPSCTCKKSDQKQDSMQN